VGIGLGFPARRIRAAPGLRLGRLAVGDQGVEVLRGIPTRIS
jgi:hypothetical protein